MRLAAFLLLGALLGAPPAALAAPAALVEERAARLSFSQHARERMEQRGVTEAQVRDVVEAGESFRYFHQGRWKKGYYDEKAGLFVATHGGVVITVFAGADRRYVERLKRKKP